MNNIEKIKPSGIFTNYIFKAIPLAFDESMSYYETLCGLLSIVKTQNNVINNNADVIVELENYVNNYFKNLDVQNEINNKLDSMVEDGSLPSIIETYLTSYKNELQNDYNNFTENINNQITEQNIKIRNGLENISNGTPLIASSTDEMTNTSRIYVNTSDGKWYYYNGVTWVIGGLYQSTGIENESITPNKTTFTKPYNLIDKSTNITGKYQFENTEYDNTNLEYTQHIPIKSSTIYYIDYLRFADFYDENNNYIAGASINNPATPSGTYQFTSPINAKYVVISYSSQYIENYLSEDKYYHFNELNKFYLVNNSDVEILKNCINTSVYNGFIKNIPYINNSVLNSYGIIDTSTSYFTTAFIPCKPTDNIYITPSRVIAFYDKNFGLLNVIINETIEEKDITVPNNAYYMRISFRMTDILTSEIYSKSYFNYLNDKINNKQQYKNYIFENSIETLESENELIAVNNLNNKKNCSYLFECNFLNFGELSIGHGRTEYSSSFIKIDNTNLYIYSRIESETTPTLKETYPHNLSLSNYIKVIIKVYDNSDKAKITITTSTGQFIKDNVNFIGCNGNVFAYPENMTCNNAVLKYIVNDMKQKIYAFGDSYFSINNPEREMYYLMQNGYKNILLSGFPGGNSTNELASFNKLLTKEKPKYVIWAVGMNDGDNENSINSNWLTNTETMINTCLENNITPILCTIPNVSTVNNTFKNQYVINSGYRYINLALAVGGLNDNVWYNGTLSSDGVHPTELGARLLYAQIINDVPELTQEN